MKIGAGTLAAHANARRHHRRHGLRGRRRSEPVLRRRGRARAARPRATWPSTRWAPAPSTGAEASRRRRRARTCAWVAPATSPASWCPHEAPQKGGVDLSKADGRRGRRPRLRRGVRARAGARPGRQAGRRGLACSRPLDRGRELAAHRASTWACPASCCRRRCTVACGISGQMQHMVGVQPRRHRCSPSTRTRTRPCSSPGRLGPGGRPATRRCRP